MKYLPTGLACQEVIFAKPTDLLPAWQIGRAYFRRETLDQVLPDHWSLWNTTPILDWTRLFRMEGGLLPLE